MRKYTPAGEDIDAVVDVRAVFQQSHAEVALETMPSLLLPPKGRYRLRDYEKIFCPDLKQRRRLVKARVKHRKAEKQKRDDSKLNQTGEVVVTAAPGLGYAYQWSGKDVKEAAFSPKESRYQFTVPMGETREVTVRVRNAFGRETATPVIITREKPQTTMTMGGNRPIQLPVQPQPGAPQGGDAPPQGQMKIEAKDLPNLIRGGGQ